MLLFFRACPLGWRGVESDTYKKPAASTHPHSRTVFTERASLIYSLASLHLFTSVCKMAQQQLSKSKSGDFELPPTPESDDFGDSSDEKENFPPAPELEELLRREEARLKKKYYREQLLKQAKEKRLREEIEKADKAGLFFKGGRASLKKKMPKKKCVRVLDSDDEMAATASECEETTPPSSQAADLTEKKKRATLNQDFSDPTDSMVGASQEMDDDSVDQFALLFEAEEAEQKRKKEEEDRAQRELYTSLKVIDRMKKKGEMPAEKAEQAMQMLRAEIAKAEKQSSGGSKRKMPVCEVIKRSVGQGKEEEEGETKMPKSNDGYSVVRMGSSDAGTEEEEDNDGLEVVDLTTPSCDFHQVKGKIPSFKLNCTWNVGIETIPCTNGRYNGSFDVFAIKRIPKDDKAKPFSFNVPVKILKTLGTALEKIVESVPAEQVLVSPERLLSIKPNADGVIDLSNVITDRYPKKKYQLDGLTMKVDQHVYKSSTGWNSYMALIMYKWVKDNSSKSAGSKKKFDCQLPVYLVPVLSAAVQHYINILFPKTKAAE
jgi:hypothetical protein